MKKTHKLSNEQKQEIIFKYNTKKYTCTDLANEYLVTKSSICRLLKNNKIIVNNNQSQLQRKYKLNEQYFDRIDSEDKAYFLGLLYADGCNFPKNRVVVINLQEKDKDILDKFKQKLNYEKPLIYVDYSKSHPNWQNQYKLHLNSKHMSNRLIELGCIPEKSLILKFPSSNQVPNNLLQHFIRGYFDGDGCIYISKDNIITCSFCSTKDFCLDLQLFLKQININSSLNCVKNNNITKTISISGNLQNKRFLNWLYKDSTIYLDRKYQKYLSIN